MKKSLALLMALIMALSCVTAGASATEANAVPYANIFYPFGEVDPTTVEFTDCTAEHPYYDHVRFAFENGMMLPTGETTFGADDQANLGDFAMACYILLGGGQNPAEAVAYFAQFGIVPAADAATPITREELVNYTLNFGAALGVPVTADMLPTFDDLTAPATRAETAMMVVSFYQMLP